MEIEKKESENETVATKRNNWKWIAIGVTIIAIITIIAMAVIFNESKKPKIKESRLDIYHPITGEILKKMK